MPKKTKKTIIAGNWKMYKTLPEAVEFVEKLNEKVAGSTCETLLAVPFTLLREVSEKVKENEKFLIGAQNMNDASEGAFTGEISARMLKDAGARFVILGHSERRQHFGESDEFINKKVKRALKEGLRVMLCIGETFDEHESGQIIPALEKQLLGSLEGVDPEAFKSIIIAYEPVWAVGSGKTALPDDAEHEIAAVRAIVAEKWGAEVGEGLEILYGGSVNAQNAKNFLDEPSINGVLIGSASLNVDDFGKILELT